MCICQYNFSFLFVLPGGKGTLAMSHILAQFYCLCPGREKDLEKSVAFFFFAFSWDSLFFVAFGHCRQRIRTIISLLTSIFFFTFQVRLSNNCQQKYFTHQAGTRKRSRDIDDERKIQANFSPLIIKAIRQLPVRPSYLIKDPEGQASGRARKKWDTNSFDRLDPIPYTTGAHRSV